MVDCQLPLERQVDGKGGTEEEEKAFAIDIIRISYEVVIRLYNFSLALSFSLFSYLNSSSIGLVIDDDDDHDNGTLSRRALAGE